jgi:hypothetical protein
MNKKIFTRLGVILIIGVLSFATISWPVAQASPKQTDSVFGVQVDPEISSKYGLDVIVPPETQTHWVRDVSVDWSQVEPSKGDRVWSGLDETLLEWQNAVNGGLTPILMVRGVPTWARPAGTVDHLCSPIKESEFDEFADFVDDVMTDAQSPLSSFDLIYWELFNEPDIAPTPGNKDATWHDCWGDAGDPYYGGETYGQMLQEVYPVIKANEPGAQVLVGGLLLDCDPDNPPDGKDCTPAKFLEGILVNGGANDGGDYFDGVSFHSFDYYFNQLGDYRNGNWHTAWNTTGPSTVAKANYLQDLLAEYGYGDKFLMNTESALLFCDGCSSDATYETTKAYYLVQAYAAAIAEELMANIWFDVHGEWFTRLTGLVDIDTLEPLPAYYAYQFASQELEGAQYVQDVTAYTGVTGYVFDLGDRIVSVIWSRDGQDHEITLPETPSAIYDVDGDTVTAVSDVTVGLMPLYIETQESINQVNVWLPAIFKNYPNLANGDFEQGTKGWTLTDKGLSAQVIPSNQGETIGTRALLLGDPDYPCTSVPVGSAEASQSFGVPYAPNAANIELRFKYVMYTQNSSFDSFEVHINNAPTPAFLDRNLSSGALSCDTWYRVPGPGNPRGGKTTGWATGSVDLSSYIGEIITVSFQNHNTTDNTYNTYTYLDEVEIVIED